jgi:hypothetical protein
MLSRTLERTSFMYRHSSRFLAPAVALFLLAGARPARADFIAWSYNWSTPATIQADNKGLGTIQFTSYSGSSGGNAGQGVPIVASLVSYQSTSSTPESFTNANYSLTLNLTDSASGNSAPLTFGGTFNGSLSSTTNGITQSFTTASNSVPLGTHDYTVSLQYIPIPNLERSPFESILLATVTATDTATAPEPSALLLAVLALPGLGLLARRKRRTALALA